MLFHRDMLWLILSLTSSLMFMCYFGAFKCTLDLAFCVFIIWLIFPSEALIDSSSAYRLALNSCSLSGSFRRSVVFKTPGSTCWLCAFERTPCAYSSTNAPFAFLPLAPIPVPGNFGGPLKDLSASVISSSPSSSLIVAMDCITGDCGGGLCTFLASSVFWAMLRVYCCRIVSVGRVSMTAAAC